uniref:ICOS ligand-like isoform X1 n=2 Tax=Centroberyx gerrardi TaxID=166262 RepID=UPI003AAB1A6F
MGFYLFSRSKAVLPFVLSCFPLLCAQTCPQWAMPALWRTGLLLSFLTYSACLEEECVLWIVGRPISPPCFSDGVKVDSLNFSIEWSRDNEAVLRSVGQETGSTNSSNVSTDAPQTGNLSLELTRVNVDEHKRYYSVFMVSGEDHGPTLCTVCLRIAASFSSPLLQREDPVEGDETVFICQSSGGFPEPAVRWLINEAEEPPRGSVSTLAAPLPDSPFFNITSQLTVNISQEATVSCIVENLLMNETSTAMSYGVQSISPVVSRASEAMWIFSTALCVVVGAMVLAGLVYQIHLDRTQKKHLHTDRGDKGRSVDTEETVVMNTEPVHSLSTETNV